MATIDKKIGLVIGPQGPQGPQGNTGPQGATGATGATPNLTIGTVTTLEPDASATASITGTAEDPVLNLGIPRGQTGEVTEEEFTQLKKELTSNLSGTRNLNTTGIGRYRSIGTAPEYINNNNYAGMTDKIPCEASTKYTATFYNVGIGTIRASYYASDGTYLSEYHASSVTYLTFTTPSNAAYLHVWIYNGSGVSITDGSHIQVEKGETSTSYIPPVSAYDRIARSDIVILNNNIDITNGAIDHNTSVFTDAAYNILDRYVCHIGANYNTFDTIPSQSIFDVERAKRLGFKSIELNVQTTSDGKFITTHGIGGKFGTAFTSLDNSDIENTPINSVTLDYIKTYVRYKSTLDKYKVAPSTLEEMLVACHEAELIPAITSVSGAIEIADKILGRGNYAVMLYTANRPSGFDGICTSWLTLSVESDVLAKCDASGAPYMAGFNTGDSAYSLFTADDWISMFEMLHENGYRVSSAYLNDPQKFHNFIKYGLDYVFSGYQIPDIQTGNVCNLTDDITWSDFDTTGAVANNVVALATGETIKPNDTFNNVFLGGGALHIRFDGSINVAMGHHITNTHTITSDGTEDVFISTYFDREEPTFVITATDNTTIYNLTYKAIEV